MELNHVEAVHITDESEANYNQLQKKWRKHLTLGKKTGDPLHGGPETDLPQDLWRSSRSL
jgi:hypothetical protein